MQDYFSYNEGKGIVPDNSFRISPSQLSKFFDSTSEWYRNHLLGEKTFLGNTSTELGTCVHAAAHMYFDTQQVDHTAIRNYIASINNPDVDKNHILTQYPVMVETLINQHLIKHKGTHAEIFLWYEILPNVGIGGSIDSYDKNTSTLRDYKTIGSLDRARIPKKLPRNYWFQQLSYALLLRRNGYPVERIELVYVSQPNTGRYNDKGKPLKDYPSEVHIVPHVITQDELDIIDSCHKLVAESIKTWNEQPELRHLLAQDYRLRVKPKPILFKN